MKVEAQGGEESGIYSITNTIDNRVYINKNKSYKHLEYVS